MGERFCMGRITTCERLKDNGYESGSTIYSFLIYMLKGHKTEATFLYMKPQYLRSIETDALYETPVFKIHRLICLVKVNQKNL